MKSQTPSPANVLELKNVHKTYIMGGSEAEILKGVNFTVARSDLVAIMGTSGSGKSTLMNIIGMLDQPTSGSYHFEDIDVLTSDSDTLAHLRNRKLGFVFQSFHLLNRLTALENICLPLAYRGISGTAAKPVAMAMLEKVNLADKAEHKPNELSGGQCQRVAIARALVGKPSLILADEPTGALDTASGRQVMELFLNLHHKEGITIVVITHDPKIAEQCEHAVQLEDGLLVAD